MAGQVNKDNVVEQDLTEPQVKEVGLENKVNVVKQDGQESKEAEENKAHVVPLVVQDHLGYKDNVGQQASQGLQAELENKVAVENWVPVESLELLEQLDVLENVEGQDVLARLEHQGCRVSEAPLDFRARLENVEEEEHQDHKDLLVNEVCTDFMETSLSISFLDTSCPYFRLDMFVVHNAD